MRVCFVDRENGPERLVCEAEVLFDEGPLSGLKLVGFCLWMASRSLPSRSSVSRTRPPTSCAIPSRSRSSCTSTAGRPCSYRSRMNPFLGRNFEAMDPLEWLARLSDHIPDPGQHRTLFYGEYSNRVRGSGGPGVPAGEEQRKSKRASPSWGRMIARVYQVDPLVCTRCGKRMSILASVTDQAAIGRILDHLGLSTPEAEKPPPPAPEVLRVAEHGDGWGVPAEWE